MTERTPRGRAFTVGLLQFILVAFAATAVAQPAEAPPEGWHLLGPSDGFQGIDLGSAYELLEGRRPARTPVVAIIDSGVDITHPDFAGRIWMNDDEAAGNGVDDDGNGYVDDVHGWNFIGGADGRHVREDTYELTREVAGYRAKYADGDTATADAAELQRWRRLERELQEERAETTASLGQLGGIAEITRDAQRRLNAALGREDYDADDVRALTSMDPELSRAREVYLLLDANGITPEALFAEVERLEGLLEYGYNPEFDPRPLIGDDPLDYDDRSYGNADVAGPGPEHGTAVAGVIAAVRDNGIGVDGILNDVRIMAVRAVPAGDERDKDVANAIRYAVDNGAQVINLSFGKGYSPGKEAVDAAVRYAEEHGVLVVHAAGNSGKDIDANDNFPNPRLANGSQAANWLEIGASTFGPELAASFSNYGRAGVDLFAPGERIYSLRPGGETGSADGTSLAAPVVSGVAALLLSYFPELTPADVREIIVASARTPGGAAVRPGDGSPASFSDLSVTGGMLDAAAAVRMAIERTSGGSF
jgi:subtilisin family serine protease